MPVQQFGNPHSLLTYNSYTPDFVGKPIQQMGQSMLAQSNANRNIVDNASKLDIALSNLQVNPLDQDYLIEQKTKFKDAINNIANSDNPNTAEATLNKVYHDYATNQGLKHSILRYQQYNNARAQVQANRAKYDPSAYNMLMNTPFTRTEPDKNGFYSDFALPNLSYKYDVSKELNSLAKNMPTISRDMGVEKAYDTDGNQVGLRNVVREYKDVDRMRSALYNKVVGDDNAINSARQLAMTKNATGDYRIDKDGKAYKWTTNDIIHSWINPIVESYSGVSEKDNYKYSKNSLNGLNGNSGRTSSIALGNVGNSSLNDLAEVVNVDKHKITSPITTDYHSSRFGVSLPPGSIITQGKDTFAGYSPKEIVTKIQSNVNNLHEGEQDIMRTSTNNMAIAKYNKPFSELTDNEKIDIYGEVSKYLKNIPATNKAVSYKAFNSNIDKNQIAEYRDIFTQDPHGKIKNSKGTFIGSTQYQNYNYWDSKNKEYIKGSDFAKIINNAPDNAVITIDGKTGYKNQLSNITGDYGFSHGIVLSISDGSSKGRQFIMSDNIADTKEKANRGAAMLYDAANSRVNNPNNKDARNFPQGVPIDPNSYLYNTVKEQLPDAKYMMLSPDDAAKIKSGRMNINNIKYIYITNGSKVMKFNPGNLTGKQLLEVVSNNARNTQYAQ